MMLHAKNPTEKTVQIPTSLTRSLRLPSYLVN